jgi:hypothetical protein
MDYKPGQVRVHVRRAPGVVDGLKSRGRLGADLNMAYATVGPERRVLHGSSVHFNGQKSWHEDCRQESMECAG